MVMAMASVASSRMQQERIGMPETGVYTAYVVD